MKIRTLIALVFFFGLAQHRGAAQAPHLPVYDLMSPATLHFVDSKGAPLGEIISSAGPVQFQLAVLVRLKANEKPELLLLGINQPRKNQAYTTHNTYVWLYSEVYYHSADCSGPVYALGTAGPRVAVVQAPGNTLYVSDPNPAAQTLTLGSRRAPLAYPVPNGCERTPENPFGGDPTYEAYAVSPALNLNDLFSPPFSLR